MRYDSEAHYGTLGKELAECLGQRSGVRIAKNIHMQVETDIREVFYERFWTPCYSRLPDSEWDASCWFPELQCRNAVIFYEVLLASTFACDFEFLSAAQRRWFACLLLRLVVGGKAADDASSNWLPIFLAQGERERDDLMMRILSRYLPKRRAVSSMLQSLLDALRRRTTHWITDVLSGGGRPVNTVADVQRAMFVLSAETATELAHRMGIATFISCREPTTASARFFLRDARDYLWAYFIGLKESLHCSPSDVFENATFALSPRSYLDLLAVIHADFLSQFLIGTYETGVDTQASWYRLLMEGVCEMYGQPYSFCDKWFICVHQQLERSTHTSSSLTLLSPSWIME